MLLAFFYVNNICFEKISKFHFYTLITNFIPKPLATEIVIKKTILAIYGLLKAKILHWEPFKWNCQSQSKSRGTAKKGEKFKFPIFWSRMNP